MVINRYEGSERAKRWMGVPERLVLRSTVHNGVGWDNEGEGDNKYGGTIRLPALTSSVFNLYSANPKGYRGESQINDQPRYRVTILY